MVLNLKNPSTLLVVDFKGQKDHNFQDLRALSPWCSVLCKPSAGYSFCYDYFIFDFEGGKAQSITPKMTHTHKNKVFLIVFLFSDFYVL